MSPADAFAVLVGMTSDIELELAGESVGLKLTHEIDKPDSKLFEAASNGWPHLLASLKSLRETGESLVETRRWPEGI